MEHVSITAAGLAFVARLESERAPRSAAWLRSILPYEAKILQARWSGFAAWIPLGVDAVDVPVENGTYVPQPGHLLLYPGGVKSWSIVAAIQDLGIHVVATGTKKSTEEDKERIRALMGEDAKMIEDGNARGLLNLAREYRADILSAGGRNLYTAIKARLPFLDVNQERDHRYPGYQGMLTLSRQPASSKTVTVRQSGDLA